MQTEITIPLGGTTGIEFVLVRPGSFIMGDDQGEFKREKPEHPVRITCPFYLGRYPVTQAQWRAVMGKAPSEFRGDDRPVECVSWQDIAGNGKENQPAFLDRLTDLVEENDPTFRGTFRLPTEAEWEYAAKGGHLAVNDISYAAAERYPTYAGGDELAAAGWYGNLFKDEGWNNNGATLVVGYRQPNALGLYGMSGNVYEWCADAWEDIAYKKREGVTEDPENAGQKGSGRVLRGGSWFDSAGGCRAASRVGSSPADRHDDLGFRLVWVPEFG